MEEYVYRERRPESKHGQETQRRDKDILVDIEAP